MGDRLQDSLLGLVMLAIWVAARTFAPNLTGVASFALLFTGFYHAWLLGRRLLPSSTFALATGFGGVSFVAIHSLLQTLWFYADGRLNTASDIWTLAVSALISQGLYWLIKERETEADFIPRPWTAQRIITSLILLGCSLLSAAYIVVNASRAATSDAIRTPWPLIAPGTVIAVASLWVIVALAGRLIASQAVTGALTAIALFCSSSLAAFIYRPGYGFDGFLHLATERLIATTGTLSPKPFYYIGQYVFTTWLQRLTDLPLEDIDRWLVPVALALVPTLCLAVALRKTNIRYAYASFLLLPLAPFIATTPQALAYVLGLGGLLLALGVAEQNVHWLAPLLLSAWAIAVHPLAGVPIFIATCATLIAPWRSDLALRKTRLTLSILFAVGSAIAIPVLFYLLSLKGTTDIHWNLNPLFQATTWQDLFAYLKPWIGNTFTFWPAWVSLFAQATPILLLAFAIYGAWKRERGTRLPFFVLILSSLLLFVSAVALKSISDFAFLIDYERSNYAERLNIIALLILLPPASIGIDAWLRRLTLASPFIQYTSYIAILLCAAAQVGNALPRHDALVTGRGWSVGKSDVEAVRAIDRDAAGKPYTVLANQSVSAAAVSQLGFKRYNGDVFFYPIPTGGALYDVFLRMTYGEPSRDTAKDAAKLGGSDLVYIVVNDYWWQADIVSETLSGISNASWSLGNADQGLGHAVRVFKMDLSAPSTSSSTTSGS